MHISGAELRYEYARKNHDVPKELCVKGSKAIVEQLVAEIPDERGYNVLIDELGCKGARRDVTIAEYAFHLRVCEFRCPLGLSHWSSITVTSTQRLRHGICMSTICTIMLMSQ